MNKELMSQHDVSMDGIEGTGAGGGSSSIYLSRFDAALAMDYFGSMQ